jgi:hypothetical protein
MYSGLLCEIGEDMGDGMASNTSAPWNAVVLAAAAAAVDAVAALMWSVALHVSGGMLGKYCRSGGWSAKRCPGGWCTSAGA